MKTLKMSLVAAALLISGFAYAGDKKSETKTTAKSGTVLYWFSAVTGTYQFANTVGDEETRTGCIDGSPTCERGYNQSQLVNPANPSQGVKSTEINNQQASLQVSE